MALQWQTFHVPFTGGHNDKAHEFVLDPPGLLTALNVEFDELGALRLRRPYVGIGTSILGGGTLSNARKLAVAGDELLCFTSTEIYAWSDAISKWVSRGTHYAVKVEEATRFDNTTDQTFADRAQLSGVIVYTWMEAIAGSTLGYVAAVDAETGAVLVSPTSIAAGVTRPRVVATTTAILIFWQRSGTGLEVKVFDPAAPAFVGSGATLVSANEGAYDVMKDPANDRAVGIVRAAGGASYTAFRVTGGGAVTATAKARTADGVVAVACTTLTDRTAVLRSSGTNVVADILVTSTLADVFTATAVGSVATAVSQLTAAFIDGQSTCYAFWTDNESTNTTAYTLERAQIDATDGTAAGETTVILRQGIASRAFPGAGTVQLWTVFAGESGSTGMTTLIGLRGQQQNTYCLLRYDGYYVAKAAWGRAAGLTATAGHLPGVALISGTTGWAWCGVERQIIELGGTDRSGYGARAPRDILFTFDSDEARRTASLGRTLYIAGSPVSQYDGESAVEVGFEQYPWYFDAQTPNTGTMPAGLYSYKATLRWDNGRGEIDRSSTATGGQVTLVANDETEIEIPSLHVTRKQPGIVTPARRNVALEIWRTKVNPAIDAPFYLTNSKDPTVTGDNEFTFNTTTLGFSTATYTDNMADATLETKEQSPENGLVLPRLAPPPASVIAASDTRLFLAGVAGEPYRVHYSLLRDEHEVAGFNGALSFALPTHTGAITALAFLNETLIAFTATAIYAVPGDGFDNTGGGSNFGPPRLLSSDLGAVSHDSVALTPGGLVFQSRKGIYRLGRGWELDYVGAPVDSFNDPSSDPVVAAHVVESQHQVRFLTAARMFVWDYLVNQWSEWSQSGGKDLAMWNGSPMLLDTAAKEESSSFSGVDYYMEIETAWIKLSGILGFGRLRWLEFLGEPKNNHRRQVRLTRDYKTLTFDDKTTDVEVSVTGAGVPIRHTPTQQRMTALKVNIKISRYLLGTTLTVDPITLIGLSLEVGLYPGLYRRLPTTQKQ